LEYFDLLGALKGAKASCFYLIHSHKENYGIEKQTSKSKK